MLEDERLFAPFVVMRLIRVYWCRRVFQAMDDGEIIAFIARLCLELGETFREHVQGIADIV